MDSDVSTVKLAEESWLNNSDVEVSEHNDSHNTQNVKRAMDSIAPYLKDFAPVPYSTESNTLKNASLFTAKSKSESVIGDKIKTVTETTTFLKPKMYGKIGMCAMDAKVLSKPCREILNRIMKFGEFETVIFGEKCILDESIENWPICDFLISFFSNGFPLDKAIEYAKLRKPFLLNDLIMQKVLWDRRLCLRLLEAANVATPARLEISRDGGPVNFISEDMKQKLIEKHVNVDPIPEPEWKMLDDDTLWVDGQVMKKPFVEKPVDGEDHNVYIYYPSSTGGGGRRLFRKVGNKSSQFDASLTMIRTSGSFIYEKFMDTENLEDVKAYTVGQDYCHAETRKSPVVDGIVRRNTRGKELRFLTTLTEEERDIAKRVSKTFDQTICGFDILRAGDASLVIDVNGFSFVKDSNEYYDNCAQILRRIFKKESPYFAYEEDDLETTDKNTFQTSHPKGGASVKTIPAITLKPSTDSSSPKWTFKGVVTVIRHADRTPKQKFKYSFRSPIFISLLKGHKEEVILRQVSDLKIVLQTIILAEEQKLEDPEKLHLLGTTLSKKLNLPGTKIQLKPVIDENNEVAKVQFILKWGGEPTHSAKHQAIDLGETIRQDVQLLNKDAINNVKVFTSSERRVIASAKLWSCSFLETDRLPENFLKIRKDLLDDSNAAKDLMDKVKKKIKPLLRQGIKPPKQFSWPPNYPDPYYVTKRVVELMNYHQKVMDYNFKHHDVGKLQDRWCCNEDSMLFKERWDKLFKEFATFEKVDPSKISELYDTMKFDALHNRDFLQNIFYPPDLELVTDEDELRSFAEDFESSVLCDTYPINVLAMNNFKLPSDHSSTVTSRSSSSVKLAQQIQVSGNKITESSSAPNSLPSVNPMNIHNNKNYLPVHDSMSPSRSGLRTALSSASSSPQSAILLHKVISNESDNTTNAGSLGWILKADHHARDSRTSSPFDDSKFNRLRELYKLAKVLFDFVCPQEYGIENNEKLDIGLLTSMPLAKQVLSDISEMIETSEPATVAYFTKESHIYTLLNIIYESKLPMRIERNALPELDYLSQIMFEVYERVDSSGLKKHSIRMSLSPGCHTQDPLDVQLDNRHYISNIRRISLTRHLDSNLVMQKLKSRFSRVSLPKKFTPVTISSPLVIAESTEDKDKDIPRLES